MMTTMSIKTLIIMLTITFVCLSQVNNTNTTNSTNTSRITVNYAPAPPIAKTEVLNITTTNTTIGSNKLQVIDARVNNATNSTEIRISSYNRSAPTKQKNYSLPNLPGSWELFKNSPEDISCQVIKQMNSNTINLLRFDEKKGQFRAVISISQSQIRNLLGNDTRNNSFEYIKNNLNIGANCSLLSIQNKIIKINQVLMPSNMSNMTNTSSNSSNSSNIVASISVITTAANFRPSYISPSLIYAISDNKLFKYRNSTYEQVYQFPGYDKFVMTNFQNRIIITGSKSFPTNITFFNQTTNTTQVRNAFQFNQTIFILLDQMTSVVLVSQLPLQGKSDGNSSDSAPISFSPGLTKIGLIISKFNSTQQAQNSTKQFALINVDYNGRKINPIKNQNPQKLANLLKGVRGPKDYIISDNFLVVRNQGLCGTPGVNCTQACYQFVGDNLKEIGSREVTDPAQRGADFEKIFFDRSIQTSAIVLVAVKTVNGLKITEYNYNNYAAKTKVIVPAAPKFFEAQIGPNDEVFLDMGNNIQLSVRKIEGGNQTTISSIKIKDTNDSSGQNIRNQSAIFNGDYKIVDSNSRCGLILNSHVQNGTSNGTSLLFINQKLVNGSQMRTPIMSSDFPPPPMSPNTTYFIGSSCDKLMINNAIFARVNVTTWVKVTNNITTFNRNSMDQSLTYGVLNGNIWKYNSNQRIYSNYFNHTLGMKAGILSNNSRLIVRSMNQTSNQVNLRIFAYLDDQNSLRPVFNYSQNYIGDAQIKLPAQNDKIVIIGKVPPPVLTNTSNTSSSSNTSNIQTKADIFSFDFNSMTALKVNFPRDTLNGPQIPKVELFGRFMYVRQALDPKLMGNMTNSTAANYSALPRSQFVYYFDDNKVPQLIFTRAITASQGTFWLRSMIKQYGTKLLLLNAYLEVSANNSKKIVIASQQISTLAAKTSATDTSKSFGVLVVNNALVTCFVGCKSCSSRLSCDVCSLGFQLINDGSSCFKCAPGCISCDSTNAQSCTSCFNGTYLSGTSCLPCKLPCVLCTGSDTNCTSCLTGLLFVSSSCTSCTVKNCLNCTSLTVCQTCKRGFALTTNGTCRPCPSFCSNCNPSNIMQCLSCAKGFVMKDSKCVRCKSKCLTCNENLVCQNCTTGYKANSIGECVLQCKYPCLDCQENRPNVCTSCYGTDLLVGTQCKFDVSCNSTVGCQACGVGYFLLDTYCYSCAQVIDIPNCLQCNSQLNCILCQEGYYLNSSGLCAPCNAKSKACLSQTVSTKCTDGSTLPTDASQGVCIECQYPCATCLGTSTTCTSCVDGKIQKGSKCQNNTYSKCSFILMGTTAQVLELIDSIILRLLVAIGENDTTRTDLVSIQSVRSFSTIVEADVTSSSGASASSTSAALAAGLASITNIGNLTLGSISVTTQGESSESKSNNAGMIAGIVVGCVVGVAIIAGLLIYFLYVKKKAMNAVKIEDINNENIVVLQNQKAEISNYEMNNFQKV